MILAWMSMNAAYKILAYYHQQLPIIPSQEKLAQKLKYKLHNKN